MDVPVAVASALNLSRSNLLPPSNDVLASSSNHHTYQLRALLLLDRYARVVQPGQTCIAFFASKALLQELCAEWANLHAASAGWKAARPSPYRDVWQDIRRDFAVIDSLQYGNAASEPAAGQAAQPAPQEPTTFEADLDAAIAAATRPVLVLAVMRSSLSEGLDLKDNRCRMALIFGVPLPPFDHPLTSRLHTELHRADPSGPSFVTHSAMQAVNQTIGRVMRHTGDFGMAVLVDERYARDFRSKGDLHK